MGVGDRGVLAMYFEINLPNYFTFIKILGGYLLYSIKSSHKHIHTVSTRSHSCLSFFRSSGKEYLFLIFPVLLRNRLISAGFETVLFYTKQSCKALYYKQFSTNIKIKIIKSIPVFIPSVLTKKVLIFQFFILISGEICL